MKVEFGMDFKIKRPLSKRPTVNFRCAICNRRLTAPLSDAGKKDTCPVCRAIVDVPGQEGLALWKRHQTTITAQEQNAASVPPTPNNKRRMTYAIVCVAVV